MWGSISRFGYNTLSLLFGAPEGLFIFVTSRSPNLRGRTTAPDGGMNRRRNRDDGDEGAAILDVDVAGDERDEKQPKKKVARELILDGLNHEAKNAIMLSMYDNAVKKLNAQNRMKFSQGEQDDLLRDINSMARLEIPSWRALKDRLFRIQSNGGIGRKAGSGRPVKWMS
jgi:hypothetical protein